jgi:3-isopropylmalate dehydrogenase
MTFRIAVMQGDGIGREIVPVARAVLDGAVEAVDGLRLEIVDLPIGASAIEEFGTPVPEATLAGLATCDGWILGPHDNQSYPLEFRQGTNPSGALRTRFQLYANHRPSAVLPGIRATCPNLDVLVVRENTEGFYADRNMAEGLGEFMPTMDVALSVGVFTRRAIERIARAASEAALARKKRLTIVHKANVLRLTSGLFRDVCYEVAEEYGDVHVDDYHIDAVVALLVRDPEAFDVLVCENMFGDILSELAAELAGGLGLSPSLNAGDQQAMAQATHGAAPDIAGLNVANPVGILLSLSMLLGWLGSRTGDAAAVDARAAIEAAVRATLAEGVRTRDIGGSASTSDFGGAVLKHLAKVPA